MPCWSKNIFITILFFFTIKINAMKLDYNQLFLLASKSGNITSMLNALENGADVNFDGSEALFSAIYSRNFPIVQILLKAKANVNVKDSLGEYSPLSLAIMHESFDIMHALLSAKADANLHGGTFTNLTRVADKNNIEVIKILINANADVNDGFGGGSAVLEHAILYRKIDIINLLLSHGAKAKNDIQFGDFGDLAVLRKLIGINNEQGQLLAYVLCGSVDQVQNLLKHSYSQAMVNYADNNKMTPLMYAASRGNAKILTSLLEFHKQFGELDLAAENNYGDNALDLAQKYKRYSIVTLFSKNATQYLEAIHKITSLPWPLSRLIVRLLFGQNTFFEKITVQESQRSKCVIQ